MGRRHGGDIKHVIAERLMSAKGLPSKFEWKMLLLFRGGYVRELAAASYPHIHGGGSDFSSIAGGSCGERRLT